VKDVEVLEKVQERAIRQVNGLRGTTYEQKLKELKMDSLADRREEADMILVYKVLNGKCNVKASNWFAVPEPNENEIRTRSALDDLQIRPSRTNLDLRKHFFKQRVCENWNKLPRNIRAAKSVTVFRREYRKVKHGETTEGAGR
jgi:hypothetical protein